MVDQIMIFQGNVWRIDVSKIDYGPAAPHTLSEWLQKAIAKEFKIPLESVEVTWELIQGKARYITQIPSSNPPVQLHDLKEEFTDLVGLSSISAKLFP